MPTSRTLGPLLKKASSDPERQKAIYTPAWLVTDCEDQLMENGVNRQTWKTKVYSRLSAQPTLSARTLTWRGWQWARYWAWLVSKPQKISMDELGNWPASIMKLAVGKTSSIKVDSKMWSQPICIGALVTVVNLEGANAGLHGRIGRIIKFQA